ncbi:hypothetical protein ABMA27_010937 [Loxostege sticticalis]|uniref:NF-kappa-B-repressing factor n=1 Tax=Loxostege sticticalis TaxID=481309 RepID=A0ABR3H336_LOXSC
MSFDVDWDTDKHKEDHECEEHWQLRRAFMERWKHDYPEERLVCLARVFANMEFMGCRYPSELMLEVSRLSQEIVQSYRNSKKNKLQRTFVSASTAAEDRAKGVKRQGGVVQDTPPSKSAKIQFVRPGEQVPEVTNTETNSDNEEKDDEPVDDCNGSEQKEKTSSQVYDNEYLKDMLKVKCLDIRQFRESMFETNFGRMVLLIRPWAGKLSNIQASCQVCGVQLQNNYESGCFTITLNGKLLARATGDSKQEAKSIVEIMAWNRLREEVVSVFVKEMWIAQGERISVSDVSQQAKHNFGAPIESSVATKMMKLMGWKGGGLGADAQGIAEPIKPNMQLVNRAGLGSSGSDIRQLRRSAQELMRRYIASDTLDLDLVFSAEFSKDERALLHQVAQRAGLNSRSYGADKDRFLVVKKKLNPFSLALAVIEKGGITPKYQVFIPAGLHRNGR